MSLGIKRTKPMRAIHTSFEGTPGDIPLRLEEMFGWALGRRLRTGDKDSSGRYNLPWTAVLHDEDGTTPETPRKIELWMPIDGAGPSQGNYVVKDIHHGNVAFMIHKGPMSKFQESIDQLFEWAKQKEQPYRGRVHRRIYVRGVDANPEDPDWEAEIQIPLLAGRSVV
ncbi:MAG TPA: GyrI-like domain-containing protein [Candidatus Krumholzibacteria bacterium]|jgi:GyrI-like small molecule binding protein|nr:GyrI-like domain-containing protein [Candidatus Krumholzibacteria bacterium]